MEIADAESADAESADALGQAAAPGPIIGEARGTVAG
jgi:hypothetical protein